MALDLEAVSLSPTLVVDITYKKEKKSNVRVGSLKANEHLMQSCFKPFLQNYEDQRTRDVLIIGSCYLSNSRLLELRSNKTSLAAGGK